MRIAHFSDVHALSLEGVPPWDFLNKRAAGWLNLRLKRRNKHPVRLFEAMVEDVNRERPDHVMVTGDLTNLSLEPEFVARPPHPRRGGAGPARGHGHPGQP